MMNRSIYVLSLILAFASIMAFQWNLQTDDHWNENTPVYEILFDLGEEKPAHYVDYDEELLKKGQELVLFGRMEGSKYVSKYYVCTSCHNIQREDPDLKVIDQDARLKYALDNEIPYLQATTFWGTVNRKTWYNDDYIKKYGDLVKIATNDLKESIQLCASVCSQGRRLSEEEMNATLVYLWSLQMKLGDLDLSDHELRRIYASQSTGDEEGLRELIKSKYLSKSPATFGEAPENKEKGYAFEGRKEYGKAIYNLGCKHCHRPKGESDVVFDDSKLTFRWFRKNFDKDSQLSIYNIIRYGTYPYEGHQEYMPHYTLEKMSDQQVEDLRAYIEWKAEGN